MKMIVRKLKTRRVAATMRSEPREKICRCSAKCLRCGAGNEWIQHKLLKKRGL